MSALFECEDRILLDLINAIRQEHNLSANMTRLGELHRALTALSKIEDNARQAQWRILDILKGRNEKG